MGETGESAAGAISKILGGVGGFALVGGAVNLATEAWGWYSRRAEEAARKAEELAAAHRDLNDALAEGDITAAASQFDELYGDVIDLAEQAGFEITDVVAAINAPIGGIPPLIQELMDMEPAERAAIDGADELLDAMIATRGEMGTTGSEIDQNTSRLEKIAAGLGLTADAEDDVAAGAADSTEALEAQRQELEQAAAAAQEYATTVGSIDWEATELEAATSAMSAYTAQLFAADNQAQTAADAYRTLGASIEQNGTSFDVSTEAGAANQDALEGVAAVLDTQLAEAYDKSEGNMAAFQSRAATIRQNMIDLLAPMVGGTEAATALVDSLGTLPPEVESRFNLAGAEEARLKIGLLQSTIGLLEEPVQMQVGAAIAAGEWQTALDLIAENVSQPVDVPVGANPAEYEDTIGGILSDVPSVELPTSADSGAAEDIAAIPETAPPVEVETSAGPGASEDINAIVAEPRTATIDIDVAADTAVIAAQIAGFTSSVNAVVPVTVIPDIEEVMNTLRFVRDFETETTVEAIPDIEETMDTLRFIRDMTTETEVEAIPNIEEAMNTLRFIRDMITETTVRAIADTSVAGAQLRGLAATPLRSTITAEANTGAAENELNHTARPRTSTIYVNTVGGGSGFGRGYSGSARSAAPSAAPTARGAAPAAHTTTVDRPHVTINTAVIGDRYDVQRVVSRAVRGAVRLAGARA